jgi:hypothetical protein
VKTLRDDTPTLDDSEEGENDPERARQNVEQEQGLEVVVLGVLGSMRQFNSEIQNSLQERENGSKQDRKNRKRNGTLAKVAREPSISNKTAGTRFWTLRK